MLGPPPVCLPVIQLVKEALLNRCTVPGYYGAIHACNGRNSQVLSSELASTYQFTTVNDKGISLGKHSFPRSNLVTRCLRVWFTFQRMRRSSQTDHVSLYKHKQRSHLKYVLCLCCMYAAYTERKVKQTDLLPKESHNNSTTQQKRSFVLLRMLEISNRGLANTVCHSENFSSCLSAAPCAFG